MVVVAADTKIEEEEPDEGICAILAGTIFIAGATVDVDIWEAPAEIRSLAIRMQPHLKIRWAEPQRIALREM